VISFFVYFDKWQEDGFEPIIMFFASTVSVVPSAFAAT
jgi:hypothetical protein